MSVPVLICPVLNRPDLLAAMIDSIDYPIDRTIIIDNGGVVPPEIEAVRLPRNIGVSASWNLGIHLTIDAPWWLIVNSDITFGVDDLARFEHHVIPGAAGIWLGRDWSAFAITPAAIEKIGFFDTGFVNGYCEDNDFAWRAYLAGVGMAYIPSGITHVGSATIGSDPKLRAQNDRSFEANVRYYTKKWGGPMHEEKFTTPFNEGGSIRDIRTDPERIRDYSWK